MKSTPPSPSFDTPSPSVAPKGAIPNAAVLIQRWQAVKARIAQAALKAAREPQGIELLAVSKTFSLQDIVTLKEQGQRCFGENYIQEAVEKIESAKSFSPMKDAQWHCIGPLQSNKTKWVAQCFDWVHTLEQLKHAQRLNEQRPAHLPPLNVLIQVNVDEGPTKAGVQLQEVLPLAKEIMGLGRLRLRGVMTLPDFSPEFDAQLAMHQRGQAVFASLQKELGEVQIDTLSMGMTQDLEAAIVAGSTLVRVGTAIFGGRTEPTQD
ncbi:MAG: YggS family pyridoxal phosphate-dependent enzyme [Burkholderiaceae bacterium]